MFSSISTHDFTKFHLSRITYARHTYFSEMFEAFFFTVRRLRYATRIIVISIGKRPSNNASSTVSINVLFTKRLSVSCITQTKVVLLQERSAIL